MKKEDIAFHMEKISKILFRAFVICFVMLNFDRSAIFAAPLGVLIAVMSEASYIIKMKR